MAVTHGTTALPAPYVTTPTHSMATTLSTLSNSPVEVQSGTSTQAATNLKRPADQAFGTGDQEGMKQLPDESMYPWTNAPVPSSTPIADIS